MSATTENIFATAWQRETQNIASLSPYYPQFTRVTPPSRTAAESAWMGKIQPFTSDENAKSFLHDIESNGHIWVSAGRIKDSAINTTHWADPLLVNMTMQCKLLILVQPTPAHPRAYLINPLFPDYYSAVHPHPRHDQLIQWQGRDIPGLCIYSASEFVYDEQVPFMKQFLDQVTLYVARHLIWLRTRQLFCGPLLRGTLVRSLMPGELLLNDRPMRIDSGGHSQNSIFYYWRGYWAGPSTRAGTPASHLKLIRPSEQCWCGSGVEYGTCHRNKDYLMLNLSA